MEARQEWYRLAGLAAPELESGQLLRVSEVFLENFGYYLLPGSKQPVSSSAADFRGWLQTQSLL